MICSVQKNFLFFFLLCTSFLSLVVTSSAPASSPSLDYKITLLEKEKALKVVIKSSSPLQRMNFYCPYDGFRSRYWKVQTEGLCLKKRGEEEFIEQCRSHRKKKYFDEVTLSVPMMPYKREEYKIYDDYYPFQYDFSTGDHLFYTGVFNIAEAPTENNTFHISAPDKLIFIDGHKGSSELSWKSPANYRSGTYFFIGMMEPEIFKEAKGFSVFIDPGFPPFLLEEIKKRVPQIIASHQEIFQKELSWPVTVMFTWRGPQKENKGGAKGDSLPAFLQMYIENKGDEKPKKEEYKLVWINHFFAHEIGHQWNVGLLPKREDNDRDYPWFHEGGANYLASLTLKKIGVFDEKMFQEKEESQLKKCVEGLAGKTLAQSRQIVYDDLDYSCGEVFFHLLDKTLIKGGYDQGVSLFWQKFFSMAHEKNFFNEKMVWECLEKNFINDKNRSLLPLIKEFIYEKSDKKKLVASGF